MSYTIEKINANIEETFAKKYGVCIDGGMPQTATGLEALCHRVYNKGWADCREKMLNKRWIPCSERLPEEEGTYLISRMTYEGYVVDIYPFTPDKELSIEWWTDEFDAWMPLPEPYKEGVEV